MLLTKVVKKRYHYCLKFRSKKFLEKVRSDLKKKKKKMTFGLAQQSERVDIT